ncbi:phosphatase PAP2/dual specificity phosphatase family protein [Hydrogenophaga sp.]
MQTQRLQEQPPALEKAHPRALRRVQRPWARALGWLCVLGPFFYLSYGLANHWASQRVGVPSLVFGWEHHIPFVPWMIVPYWSINIIYALSLFLSPHRHGLDRHAARLLTAQAVAVTCFILWPLHFSFGQPQADGLPGAMFSALRSFDQPFNQAPSLHIALVLILWDWYRRVLAGRTLALAVLDLWSLLIAVSVLLTYQHHFIDVPTGALLGVFCIWLWPMERVASLPRAFRLTRNRRALCLAMGYASGAALCLSVGIWLGGWGLWLGWPAAALALVGVNYLGLSERGFAMDHHGRMSWAAAWLFAPYRGLARLNAWAWTRKLPAAVEVAPGVWVGRQPSQAEWHANGRPALLSVCAELQAPPGMSTHCVPMLDLIVARPTQIRRATRLLQQLCAQQSPVWVCCALGFSRSAATVLAWQVRHGTAPSVAHLQLQRMRPQVVLGPDWMTAIRRMAGASRAEPPSD